MNDVTQSIRNAREAVRLCQHELAEAQDLVKTKRANLRAAQNQLERTLDDAFEPLPLFESEAPRIVVEDPPAKAEPTIDYTDWQYIQMEDVPGIGELAHKLYGIGFHEDLGDLADALSSGVALEDLTDPELGDAQFTPPEVNRLRDTLRSIWTGRDDATEALAAIEPESWRIYRVDFKQPKKGKKETHQPRFVEAHNSLDVAAWCDRTFGAGSVIGIDSVTTPPEGAIVTRLTDPADEANRIRVEKTEPLPQAKKKGPHVEIVKRGQTEWVEIERAGKLHAAELVKVRKDGAVGIHHLREEELRILDELKPGWRQPRPRKPRTAPPAEARA